MSDPKEHQILFNTEMVRAVLDGRTELPAKVYARANLRNDPQTIANRLMNGVRHIDENGCWVWGRTVSAGYGSLTVSCTTQRAHVLAWWVQNGRTVPRDMCVCHTCDQPLCINPNHLFLGTRSDNMQDMVAKGRHGGAPPSRFGENNPSAKLTREQVTRIKRRLSDGHTQQSIAADFGISQSQVSNINRGLQWR